MDYRSKLELLGFQQGALYLGNRNEKGVPEAITEVWSNRDESLEIVNRCTRVVCADEILPAHYQTMWSLCQDKQTICSTINLDSLLTALGRVLMEEKIARTEASKVIINRRLSYV